MAGIYAHRLVGKFFTSSTPPTLEETEESLREQWAISGGDLTVEEQDNDKFLFEFSQWKDKDEAKRKGPFYVNGVMLVLKDPDCGDKMDFTVALFGVAVLGLPWYLVNKDYFPTLKSKIGEFNPTMMRKPYQPHELLLFGVNVDLKKPLRAGYYLGENRFVEFKYWNLGDFCYNCGMIDHVKEDCDKLPKERALNATDTTPLYGPWLRFELSSGCYETVLTKSENNATVVKTPSDAEFVIEAEFNCLQVCEPRIKSETVRIHTFCIPCSYLYAKTDSTSKAYKAIEWEINENKPCCFREDKPDFIENLVEELKVIQKNEFSCDDKLLNLKLQVNHIKKLAPVEYETMLAIEEDRSCERLMESKISDLIKTRVEQNDVNLSILSSWETQIREVLTEVGLAHSMEFLEVPRRASEAMAKAEHKKVMAALRRRRGSG